MNYGTFPLHENLEEVTPDRAVRKGCNIDWRDW